MTEGDDVHHVLDMSKTSFSPESNPSLCPTSHPVVSFLPALHHTRFARHKNRPGEVYFITSKNKMLDHCCFFVVDYIMKQDDDHYV